MRPLGDAIRRRTPEPIKRVARPVVQRGRAALAEWWAAGRSPGDLATAADVRDCFRLLLGRIPDERGMKSWVTLVEQNPVTVDELVGMFLASAEFRIRLQRTPGWAREDLKEVEVEGRPFYIRTGDVGFGAVLEAGRPYEPHVAWYLKEHLRPGQTFVDVGASVGYFSVVVGRHVGPDGRVLAFEPGPQNQSVLLLNLHVNGIACAETYPVALSDEDIVMIYSAGGGNGSVVPFAGDPASLGIGELVRSTRLDAVVGDRPVHAMKIDVEGAEGKVLVGGGATLERHHPALVFEFAPPALEAISLLTATEVLGHLTALGYTFDVLDEPGQALSGRTAEELLAHYDAIGGDHFDVAAWVPEAGG